MVCTKYISKKLDSLTIVTLLSRNAVMPRHKMRCLQKKEEVKKVQTAIRRSMAETKAISANYGPHKKTGDGLN